MRLRRPPGVQPRTHPPSRRIQAGRIVAAAAVAAAAVALAACGGSKAGSTTSGSSGLSGTVALTPTAPHGSTSTTSSRSSRQPGGAAQAPGGSEPARAPATLTGRGGKITPATVQVPPFIAVEISLASADGRTYSLTVAGRKLTVSGSHRTASVTLPGLRPGATYTATGSGQTVTITPSAEPGP